MSSTDDESSINETCFYVKYEIRIFNPVRKGFQGKKSHFHIFNFLFTLACCCSERGEKFIFRALIRLLGKWVGGRRSFFSKSKQKLIKYKVRICWKLESLEAFSRLKAQLLPLKVDSLLPAWWEKWVVDTKKLKFPAENHPLFNGKVSWEVDRVLRYSFHFQYQTSLDSSEIKKFSCLIKMLDIFTKFSKMNNLQLVDRSPHNDQSGECNHLNEINK